MYDANNNQLNVQNTVHNAITTNKLYGNEMKIMNA